MSALNQIAAVMFSLGGSLFTSLGLILMKIGNIKVEALKKENPGLKTSPLRQPIWWLGMVCLLGLGVSLNGVAMSLGNVMLISSTSCFTIICNGILAPLILKEKFQWKVDGVAIFIISAGSTVAVLVVPNEPPTKIDEQNVLQITTGRYMQLSALTYIASVITLQIARHFYFRRLKTSLDAFYRQI